MLRSTKNSGQTEITDLDLAEMAIDEEVVALEVSMYDWRIMAMEVSEALQYLASPVLNCSHVHSLILSPIPTYISQTEISFMKKDNEVKLHTT